MKIAIWKKLVAQPKSVQERDKLFDRLTAKSKKEPQQLINSITKEAVLELLKKIDESKFYIIERQLVKKKLLVWDDIIKKHTQIIKKELKK